MEIENIIFIGYLAITVVVFLARIIIGVISIKKMTKEQRIQLLKDFVCGAIVSAENELGSGKGAEKLQSVENYFYMKAPTYYKMVLRAVGKNSLQDIIEEALTEVKNGFSK